jgi:hypothetical protein
MLNRICAHPALVSCIIGACVLDAFVLPGLIGIASDWRGWAILVLAVIGASGLGFYLGMFTCWPWLRPVCGWFNGAPFKTGDSVVILAGPLRDTTAEVEEITKGQGGWDVVWLALGPERRKRFSNIFEEYSLMKINRGEQAGSRQGGDSTCVGNKQGRLDPPEQEC